MGIQVEQITLNAHQSLSFIVEDMSRARRDGYTGNLGDLEAWLNVLQSWSSPLVSESGLRGIEAWLDAVEAETAATAATPA